MIQSSPLRQWLQSVLWLVALAAFCATLYWIPVDVYMQWFSRWIETLGSRAPLVFGLVYVIATVLLFPGGILTIAVGASLGLWVGTAVISIASTITAGIAFLIARHLLRRPIVSLASHYSWFAALDAAIATADWKIVGLLRLSPFLPFAVKSYLFGVTRVRFWPYLWVSWIAMLPSTFLYVYVGYIARQTVDANLADARISNGSWAMIIVGFIATVAGTWYLGMLAKRELAQQIERSPAPRQQEGQSLKDLLLRTPSWRRLICTALLTVGLCLAAIWSYQHYRRTLETSSSASAWLVFHRTPRAILSSLP